MIRGSRDEGPFTLDQREAEASEALLEERAKCAAGDAGSGAAGGRGRPGQGDKARKHAERRTRMCRGSSTLNTLSCVPAGAVDAAAAVSRA